MKTKTAFLFCSAAIATIAFAAIAFAAEPVQNTSAKPEASSEEPDNAPIVKLQLFKNGFGFVTREIAPRNWKDPLVLKPAISPRHGTLWFEPSETIIRRTTRERTVVAQPDRKNETPGYRPDWSSMTDVYEWKDVTLKMKDGSSLSGLVIGNQKPQTTNKEQPQTVEIIDTLSAYRSSSSSVRAYSPAGTPVAVKSAFGSQFLTVQTDEGYVSVRQADVVEIRAKSLSDGESAAANAERKTKTTEEVQVVEAPKTHLGPVRMRYLSQDITWSPFYRVNLKDDGKLTIDASATVMNNLEDFEDTEVEFISGFPNMVFASSLSALSKGMSFQSFLNNLANPSEPSYLRSTSSRSSVMRQAEILSNSSVYYDMDDDEGVSARPTLWTASGMDDMQYKSAGKLSMRKGDVLQLPIASAEAEYELITTWTAPMEKRFSFGEASADATLWNCIRFRNPFDFALTSAPYEIEQDGNVLGQSTGTWFGSGQPATVKITKSMAVTATMTQTESGSLNRYYTEVKWNDNYKFHYPDVTAQIVLTNHGTKPAKVVFDSVFYGELVNADAEPKKTRLLTDNRTRNPKSKLTWEVTVPASDKTTINYTYKIILDN